MATPTQIALLDEYEATVVEFQEAVAAVTIVKEQLRLAEEVEHAAKGRMGGARSRLDHSLGSSAVKSDVMTNVESFSSAHQPSSILPLVPLFKSGLTVADLLTPAKK